MPIYEYRCASCGFQKEYLQKMSDAPLTDCPECGKAALVKMVSAAGFHLKGSGWYVTDFKHGSKPKSKPDGPSGTKPETGAAAKADDKPAAKSDESAAAKPDAKSTPEAQSTKSDDGAATKNSTTRATPVSS